MEKEEEEEERGGGFVGTVYDLQGEPKMSRCFLGLRSRGSRCWAGGCSWPHRPWNHACVCSLRLRWSRGNPLKSTPTQRSGPRTAAGGEAAGSGKLVQGSGSWGDRQGGGRGGGRGGGASRSHASLNWQTQLFLSPVCAIHSVWRGKNKTYSFSGGEKKKLLWLEGGCVSRALTNCALYPLIPLTE